MVIYPVSLSILLLAGAFASWAFLPARYLPGNRARHQRYSRQAPRSPNSVIRTASRTRRALSEITKTIAMTCVSARPFRWSPGDPRSERPSS
jgi:hypothetical protein